MKVRCAGDIAVAETLLRSLTTFDCADAGSATALHGVASLETSRLIMGFCFSESIREFWNYFCVDEHFASPVKLPYLCLLWDRFLKSARRVFASESSRASLW
jgi:hypothetical protein